MGPEENPLVSDSSPDRTPAADGVPDPDSPVPVGGCVSPAGGPQGTSEAP